MFPFSCLRSWASLIMCAVWFTCTAQQKQIVRNSDGDELTIQYTVKHQDGKTIVSFKHVSDIQLGDKNMAKYSQKRDKGLVRAIFMDGSNFNEDETIVEKENNVAKWSQFKTPALWEYESQGMSQVFCLNDRNSHPEITFTGKRDKQLLSIPIYLAHITTKNKRDWLGRKTGVTTTYHVFSEFKPLEIKLTMPKEKPEKPNPSPNPYPTKIQIEIDSPVIDSDPDPIPDPNQPDLAAKKLINEIQREMDKNSGLTDYALRDFLEELQPKIENLENLNSGVSQEVQQDIEKLKTDYNEKREEAIEQIKVKSEHDAYVLNELDRLELRLDSCTWKRLGSIDDIEKAYQNLCQGYTDKVSPTVQHALTDFDKRINDKKNELKPYFIIRKILLGLLAFITMALSFLGYSRWKNSLEQKKMKGFEAMQQKMARRAEREAERRMRSYSQNKTRQVIGQARNKGRQAVQSKAREMGERVKGKKTSSTEISSNEASSTNNGTNGRPSIGKFSGKRRPKSGRNGEISI